MRLDLRLHQLHSRLDPAPLELQARELDAIQLPRDSIVAPLQLVDEGDYAG
jgi:hypothetical protein